MSKWKDYFTSSLFFHRKFLLWHFRHFVAVAAFRLPQSLQIFMYSLAFCAMAFLTGSNIGIAWLPFGLTLRSESFRYTFCLELVFFLFSGWRLFLIVTRLFAIAVAFQVCQVGGFCVRSMTFGIVEQWGKTCFWVWGSLLWANAAIWQWLRDRSPLIGIDRIISFVRYLGMGFWLVGTRFFVGSMIFGNVGQWKKRVSGLESSCLQPKQFAGNCTFHWPHWPFHWPFLSWPRFRSTGVFNSTWDGLWKSDR